MISSGQLTFSVCFAANTAMARDAGAGVDIRPAGTVQVASGGRHFTFKELEIATGGFSEDMIIGEGCFGQVRKDVVL